LPILDQKITRVWVFIGGPNIGVALTRFSQNPLLKLLLPNIEPVSLKVGIDVIPRFGLSPANRVF
jgi:hypothetical protein